MKNKIISMVVVLLLIVSCDLFNPGSNNALSASFTLTDTLGNECSNFLMGEPINMYFSLKNTTDDTLHYIIGDSGPSIRFKIMQEDSIVATSTYGWCFLSVLVYEYLLPGDTLSGQWLAAPNTILREPKIALPPGEYEAVVDCPYFEEDSSEYVSSIPFTVNDNPSLVIAEFDISDTLGEHTIRFDQGESFNLDFVLINTTEDTLHYTRYNSGPDVRFQILLNDSLVASSMDGCGVFEIVTQAILAPNDTLTGHWLAPTTPCQDPKIILPVSFNYKATVSFPVFEEVDVFQVSDIEFWVR